MTLDDAAIGRWTAAHPGWSHRNGRIERTFVFPSFGEAIAFVTRVATLADEADHHPDIDVRYVRVLIGLSTHDAGGITGRDTSLAVAIDEVERP